MYVTSKQADTKKMCKFQNEIEVFKGIFHSRISEIQH